ncbi:diguanylate cyclase [Paraburkholderia sp. RL17-337-BIB-A]|uniref:diguanylate cyclase n=1 Tax=Paraburkholderia sp. RL17-337-BIB-A TaxID=3031636 RepID=UPI0038B89F2E
MNTNRYAGKGKCFTARIYRLRVIGLGIGSFCVASVLTELHANLLLWALLIFHGFIWPHIAYRVALAWTVPYRGERVNLMVDAAFGGFWVVAMRFNILPSVLILALLSTNNIAAGGLPLFVRGIVAHVVGVAVGVLTLGFAFAPQSQMSTILACLPFLFLYPLALGWTTYSTSQKLAAHARELERLSQTDGLTGLWNRRHWEGLLAQQFELCRAEKLQSCLVLFDLDHFKRVNDTRGHAAGDAALRSFAIFLREHLRPEDIIGRYGGEEFGVILPGLSLADAETIVELLLLALRSRASQSEGTLLCTTSAGLSGHRPDMTSFTEWLMEADRCLYDAKSNGRDRLVASYADSPSRQR